MTPIRTILHPTDFSPRSAAAFRLACSLARELGARMVVVHVQPPAQSVFGELGPFPADREAVARCMREQLSQVVPEADGPPVEHRLLEGDPTRGILDTAREAGCDLIVMGTHGRTGLGHLLMGSVAEAVLRKAPCPVLTVKAPPPQAAPAGEPPQRQPVTA
jgi:nucleotide-binding universal stress UspA family protein